MRGSQRSDEERQAALKRKLSQVTALLDTQEEDNGADVTRQSAKGATACGPSTRTVVTWPDGPEIVVIIGTTDMARRDPTLIPRICYIVDEAYTAAGKHKRMDEYDAHHRLRMGDAGPGANRVLHMAYKGDELLGVASSTYDPGWTPDGCGHWGLLAVDPKHQNKGVATALVLAAERRLAMQSEMIQIEYEYGGDEFSTRLLAWYEDKLGFHGGPKPPRGYHTFRRCHKPIPAEEQRRGQRRRLEEIRMWLMEQIAEDGKGGASTQVALEESSEGEASSQDDSSGETAEL
uniref:N-acetyltransferase domain-containing protein n=1 Tax=Noctiluca scintillans TaxID=2966 RepID=A0A7S0ZXG8_NOCSC